MAVTVLARLQFVLETMERTFGQIPPHVYISGPEYQQMLAEAERNTHPKDLPFVGVLRFEVHYKEYAVEVRKGALGGYRGYN